MAPAISRRSRISLKKSPAEAGRAPQAPQAPAEVGQNASPIAPAVRRKACVAALTSKGYDRALPAYNELAHKHRDELEALYQQHASNQKALGIALARMCGTHRISYTKKHH